MTEPQKVTVKGTALDSEGAALPGATVWVAGRPVVTNATGAFEAPEVELPYQLAYREGSATYSFYEGLRSTELSLRLDSSNQSVYTAKVSGTLAGSGVHPQPDGYTTDLIAVDSAGAVVGTGFVSSGFGGPSSAYSVDLEWRASLGSTVVVKLHALQHKESPFVPPFGSYPESFTAFGAKELTVSASSTLTNQTLTLDTVSGRYVTFNVTVPSPTLNINEGTAFYSPGQGAPVFSHGRRDDGITSPPFSLLFAETTGATASASVTLRSDDQFSTQWVRSIDDNASTFTLQPPAPVALEAPAENATLAPGQRLSWSALEGAVHKVRFAAADPDTSGVPTINLYTSETSAELPDLSAFGVPSVQGTPYKWRVVSRAPFASVDAYLAQMAKREETFTFETTSSGRRVSLP